jgi:hypothetical protein
MYVHIDPETLRRHPWIAVLIGLVGVAMMALISNAFFREYMALRTMPAPEQITADSAILGPGGSRRWVSFTGGNWHHDMVVEERRKAPECWLFGKIENTQIPVTDTKGLRLIVIKHDGKADSQSLALRPVTGMLVREHDGLWGGGISPAMAIKHEGPILVLIPGAGPAKAFAYTLGGLGFLLAFSIFTSYYLWLWNRKREKS